MPLTACADLMLEHLKRLLTTVETICDTTEWRVAVTACYSLYTNPLHFFRMLIDMSTSQKKSSVYIDGAQAHEIYLR